LNLSPDVSVLIVDELSDLLDYSVIISIELK